MQFAVVPRKLRLLFLLALVSTSTIFLVSSALGGSFAWRRMHPGSQELLISTPPPHASSVAAAGGAALLLRPLPPPAAVEGRFLSYQPTGNGWNNQRQALEAAAVLARLLNRTLVVHPMSPHDKVRRLKQGVVPGYAVYNQLGREDLLPLSAFLDLRRLGGVVRVLEYTGPHGEFLRDFGSKSWTNVCHSVGFGYWVYRHPGNPEEEALLRNQLFVPKPIWRKKCPAEQDIFSTMQPKRPIVRFVEDLIGDESNMIYFEQGTLFGISVRFFDYERAVLAQSVVTQGMVLSQKVRNTVDRIAEKLGSRFNAVHIRRTDHPYDKTLSASYWVQTLLNASFPKDLPLYISTDELDRSFFQEFIAENYTIYFYSDFMGLFNLSGVPPVIQQDFIGIHEQYLCRKAIRFMPSPKSTFSVYILRTRGDLVWKHELMTQYTSALWIPNQTKPPHS